MRAIHLLPLFILPSITSAQRTNDTSEKETYVIVNAAIVPTSGKALNLTYLLKSSENVKKAFEKIFTTHATEAYAYFYVLDKDGQRKLLARNSYSNLTQYPFDPEKNLEDKDISFKDYIMDKEKETETGWKEYRESKIELRKNLQSILGKLGLTNSLTKKAPENVTVKELFNAIKNKLKENTNSSTTSYTPIINPNTSITGAAIPEDTELSSPASNLTQIEEDIKTTDLKTFKKKYITLSSAFLLSKDDVQTFIKEGLSGFEKAIFPETTNSQRRMISAHSIRQKENKKGALFTEDLEQSFLDSATPRPQTSALGKEDTPNIASPSDFQPEMVPNSDEQVEMPTSNKSGMFLATIGTIAGAATGLTYLNRGATPTGKKRKKAHNHA